MSLDVSPYLIHRPGYPDEVGVCLTLPDGNALYLTTEEWDALAEEVDDVLVTDPALIHSSTAAQTRLDLIRSK